MVRKVIIFAVLQMYFLKYTQSFCPCQTAYTTPLAQAISPYMCASSSPFSSSFEVLPVLPLKCVSPAAAELLASLSIPSNNPLLPPASPVSPFANPVSACMPPALPPSCGAFKYATNIPCPPPFI